ncbi:MAG: dockerin type I repeat-containing protein [Ruminiclostridium sp.]|nr:dockerin type I repeat-containing protein [Ruminiclostridium sp.]
MKKKRIISAIVAVAAALCGFISFGGSGYAPGICIDAGAEEAPAGGISVSQAKVQYNGQFDVIITVPPKNLRADTVEMRIRYDPDVFEIVSWNPVLSGSMSSYDNTEGVATLVYASSSAVVELKNGLEYKATMRAKNKNADGVHTITLSRHIVSNYDLGYKWVPAAKTVDVKITHELTTLSGVITSNGVGGTAAVTLTDKDGITVSTTVTLTLADAEKNTYKGTYSFSGVEVGGTYTLEAKVDGGETHTVEIIPSGASTKDLAVNRLGDVDSDGEVTALDATQILRYLAGMTSEIKGKDGVVNEYLLSVAHVNKAGTFSVLDATQILRYVAKKTSVLGTN